jgi:hypothetical protein
MLSDPSEDTIRTLYFRFEEQSSGSHIAIQWGPATTLLTPAPANGLSTIEECTACSDLYGGRWHTRNGSQILIAAAAEPRTLMTRTNVV